MISKERGRSEGGREKNLRRFTENLQRFTEKVRRFFFFLRHFSENLRRFFDMLYDVAVIIGNRNIC